jgi:hypothetical protein
VLGLQHDGGDRGEKGRVVGGAGLLGY